MTTESWTKADQDENRKKWRGWYIAFCIVIFVLSLWTIILVAAKNSDAHALLSTYNGRRSLYTGHTLSLIFSIISLIAAIVYVVYFLKVLLSRHVQGSVIFLFLCLAIGHCGSGLTTLFSTNRGAGHDEKLWNGDYNCLIWEHSSAWDWMTHTFMFDYTKDDLWKNLQKNNNCCGVRGPWEMGIQRALWTNQTDIFSYFNFPYECCSNDVSTEQGKFECLSLNKQYSTGCYQKIVSPEFRWIGGLQMMLFTVEIILVVVMTYYYIWYHRPFWTCC